MLDQIIREALARLARQRCFPRPYKEQSIFVWINAAQEGR